MGYLHREEGVPFTRADLVRHELGYYFMRRNEGSLDPRPNLLEQIQHPNRKRPKAPPPVHPLCPERVTLDVHLTGMISGFNMKYHVAAAFCQALPAWLRFLESRRLIDAATREKVTANLRPLNDTMLEIWEKFTGDPTLYRDGQALQADKTTQPSESAP